MSEQKKRGRWKGILIRIGLVLGSTLITLLMAECAMRTFTSKPQLVGGWWMGKKDWRVLDDDLIVVKPKLTRREHYRHREGAFVIVALGDSFTEGYPYNVRAPEKVVTNVLQSMLRKAGRNVDVINVGLGDSGTDQQMRLFKKYVLPNVRPNLVLWQLYTNDITDNMVYAAYDISLAGPAPALVELDAKKHWIHRRQRIYDWAPLPRSVKDGSYLFQMMLRAFEATQPLPTAYGKNRYKWSLDKIDLQMRHMQELSRKHGFRFHAFLCMPGAVFYHLTGRPRIPGGSWKNHSAFWPFEVLRNMIGRLPSFINVDFNPDDLLLVKRRFGDTYTGDLFSGDEDPGTPVGSKHYNEFGYWLLAKKLADALLAAPHDWNDSIRKTKPGD